MDTVIFQFRPFLRTGMKRELDMILLRHFRRKCERPPDIAGVDPEFRDLTGEFVLPLSVHHIVTVPPEAAYSPAPRGHCDFHILFPAGVFIGKIAGQRHDIPAFLIPFQSQEQPGNILSVSE